MGLVSEASKSMAVAMLIPLGCYVFVAYYSYFGSKVRAPVSPAA
jgi:FHS family L-fucose permease-like MFS transporter